jgi:hypothetical protein
MKLRSNLPDDNSQTYELVVQFFKTGTAEEWLLFHRDLKKILVGQNIIAAPAKYAMARLLLSEEALMVCNTGATEHGNVTNNNFTNSNYSHLPSVFFGIPKMLYAPLHA